MHIVTFYSFKGGVGRSMALVNVATELAIKGRRVLIVDFDLEAPGIETFRWSTQPLETRPLESRQGVVEYVTEYIHKNEVPSVKDYIFDVPGIGDSGGSLWIMPAGKQDGSYARRLNEIDWQDLYANRDGFLFFEDMKSQWRESMDVDYVLIDSRTGYTDVSGICTRHLPDSVVIVFSPTIQNLKGLQKVVHDIRKEAEGPRQKAINLHFAISNVPVGDDEEGILENLLDQFAACLNYGKNAVILHHHDSLAAFRQDIFTLHHKRTRLTKEYRKLTQHIIEKNIYDEEGAIAQLQEVEQGSLLDLPFAELESRLNQIEEIYADNGNVLRYLARVKDRRGDLSEAILLLGKAIELGAADLDDRLRRANLLLYGREPKEAEKDIEYVLNSTACSTRQVSAALRLLMLGFPDDPDKLIAAAHSPALLSLQPHQRVQVSSHLIFDRQSLKAAVEILEPVARSPETPKDVKGRAKADLALCYIGFGQFSEAMSILSPERPTAACEDVRLLFNYAMAEWAEFNQIPSDLLAQVCRLHERRSRPVTPNYLQCIALSYWAASDRPSADDYLERAKQQIRSRPGFDFSAWRYLVVSASEFESDLEEMADMFSGDDVKPRFMSASHSSRKTV